MPKYKYRQKYLSKLENRKLRNFIQKILSVHNTNLSGNEITSFSDVSRLNTKLSTLGDDQEKLNTIYFTKIFQQLFDNDDDLRNTLREFKELCQFVEENNVEFIISNKIDNKIRKYLN